MYISCILNHSLFVPKRRLLVFIYTVSQYMYKLNFERLILCRPEEVKLKKNYKYAKSMKKIINN